MVQLPPSMTYSRMTSQCVLHARKQVRLHMKRIRQREYTKLRDMVPALAHKKKVDKVTVIEEAVRYIDELHKALAERLQHRPDMANAEITQDNVKYFVQDLMSQQIAQRMMTSQISRTHNPTLHSTRVSMTSQSSQHFSVPRSNAANWTLANNCQLSNTERHS